MWKIIGRIPWSISQFIEVHKFKIKLLYNEEEAFCSKAELLNFKITLPLARLDIVDSSSVTNGLVISDDILVDIQLVTFLLLQYLILWN